MPWNSGQSGNVGGRPRDKAFRTALNLAVREFDTDGKTTKLRRIADKLVACAVAGEPWAVAEVANRLDGRPHQETTMGVIASGDPAQLTDAELLAIIASAREHGDDDGEQPNLASTAPLPANCEAVPLPPPRR